MTEQRLFRCSNAAYSLPDIGALDKSRGVNISLRGGCRFAERGMSRAREGDVIEKRAPSDGKRDNSCVETGVEISRSGGAFHIFGLGSN